MSALSLFEIACFLLGGVALYAAARSHASGLRWLALAAFAHAVLAAVSAVVAHRTPANQQAEPLGIGITWTLATLTSIAGVAYCWARERRAPDEVERLLAQRARRAFALLAALEVLALPAAFTRLDVALLVVLLAYLLAPIAFAVGALRLLRVHRQRGDVARAELARFLCLSYVSIPFTLGLAILDIREDRIPYGLLFGLGVLILVNPIATLVLVGVRAPALDVVTPAYPPERAVRSVVTLLVAAGALATVLLPASVALHLSRCDGRLVMLWEPKTPWRSLPVVARGEKLSLGPFKLRGYTRSYKTYPVGTDDASLVDPKLCFSGAVSISAWFDDGATSMYRTLGELRLRHDARADAWIVSGTRRTERPDEFVTAFRRELGRRFAFDHESSAFSAAVSGFALAFGIVALVLFRRRSRERLEAGQIPDFRLAAVAYGCFLVAVAAPIALEVQLMGRPRPGAELAVEVIPP